MTVSVLILFINYFISFYLMMSVCCHFFLLDFLYSFIYLILVQMLSVLFGEKTGGEIVMNIAE